MDVYREGFSGVIFCLMADIRKAHRRVVRVQRDWGLLGCKSDSASTTLWLNRVGTFGVASASYWWARLAGTIARWVMRLLGQSPTFQLIYVDDLEWVSLGPSKFEIVTPSLSILAEPPVAVVDKVVDKRGTRKVAEAYLEFLYSAEGQNMVGKHYYRPYDLAIAKKYEGQFAKVKLFDIDDVFGGWKKAQATHFADGGVFDQIYGVR